jgi:3-oxoacyl-(acyl-carrier-protein) synthase
MVRLALLAATSAWEDAGWTRDVRGHFAGELPSEEIGVVTGTARGSVGKWCEVMESVRSGAAARPTWAGEASLAALHGTLATLVGATGPALTVSTACSSGGHAIALAASLIASGQVRCVLAGGADAPLEPLLLRQMFATGILDPAPPGERPCRPFDQSAAGTIMGEAGAFLVLESLDSAQQRGAPIRGLLHGWGMAGDGRSASPESAGAQALDQAVTRALSLTGCTPDAVTYVNCQGTGTVVNDSLESDWLHRFNRRRQEAKNNACAVAYGSTKPATGHCLGATPVLEAILCLEGLRRGEIPRTPHTDTPAAYAPPGLVLRRGQPWNPGQALTVSLGFWGASSALLLGKPDE